ncbi:aryl-sulfate sulfotransferase [Massilia sp. YIM B02769]|uniref:aryl-sulfate sulfotransferase n=1 Tax=Massilia sp. YIM B02769 TaxID=3050129 RepID=UPI0025B72798|nr:aryl-sulfate sulfotransferase [Massilia sp. YIM B02769]MDN4059921.1 aryl-sulfate sulfotransferase [Massilia sp. YIM B02769]
MKPALRTALPLLPCLLLAACHHADDDTQAEEARLRVVSQATGLTPFVANLTLALDDFDHLASVSYTIAAKPGTYSKPMSVTYTREWMTRTGAWRPADRRLVIPVFGLYAGYANGVTLSAAFDDKSKDEEQVTVAAPVYAGPAAVNTTPDVRTARSAAANPGFDYMLIKNNSYAPAVLDSDGNLRWIADTLPVNTSTPTWFSGDALYVGSLNSPSFHRVNFTGDYTTIPVASTRYTNFHHDLAAGKQGLLAEFDAVVDGTPRLESIVAEITPTGEVLKEWDLGAIFAATMRAGGDDPSNFVRDGIDWFHMNSAIYVPADDSLLVSSRENFVVKLDYKTGHIKWLLGDTTKHWYVDYPSLRALALHLTAGKPPIGQHTLSLTANGELLLFNNGYGSVLQPPGTSPGITRNFSTPSRYVIDEKAGTAAEVWTYAPEPPIYSSVCSSVYETTAGNYVVGYSAAEAGTQNRLLAVNTGGQVAFDYIYPASPCSAVFIAQPIPFTGLIFK